MPVYEGKLELTWTNKGRALLAHDNSSYEWVARNDYRVSEVRLLHTTSTFGQVSQVRAQDNLLIHGDSLMGLTSLIKLPEFRDEYVGKVRLVYIDPPFNTKQTFDHYDDSLEHSVWLTMMRDRLVEIKNLLAPTGSVWLHLDENEIHRARMLMDDVFTPEAFVTTIVWQKRTTRENRPAFSPSQDYILVYAPAGAQDWKKHRNKLTRGLGGFSNPDDDPQGPWASIPFTAKGHRKNQIYPITTPTGITYQPPFKGRCWGATEPEFDRLLADNRVYFPKGGDGKPRIKQYEWEDEGLVPDTWWTADICGTNDDAKKQMSDLFPGKAEFSTPKPELLLQRVIQIGSNPGDIVLDCFAGSGTTAAVAHKMGRRWVAIEREESTVIDYTAPRLRSVVDGSDDSGISGDLDWAGGGAFRQLKVGPTIFESEDGTVLLAERVVGDTLAEAVAAQLGFHLDVAEPFAGHRGRMRLAVIDGLVDTAVVKLIVEALGEGELVVLCGTAVDPEARLAIAELSPGSTVRKVPTALFDHYQRADTPLAELEEVPGRVESYA